MRASNGNTPSSGSKPSDHGAMADIKNMDDFANFILQKPQTQQQPTSSDKPIQILSTDHSEKANPQLNMDLQGDLTAEGAHLYGQITMFDALTDEVDGEADEGGSSYAKDGLDDDGEDTDFRRRSTLNEDIQSFILEDNENEASGCKHDLYNLQVLLNDFAA